MFIKTTFKICIGNRILWIIIVTTYLPVALSELIKYGTIVTNLLCSRIIHIVYRVQSTIEYIVQYPVITKKCITNINIP